MPCRTGGRFREILCDFVRAELAPNKGKKPSDAVPNELIVQFVVGAFLSVLIWWLDGGAKLPPQRVAALFRRLATEGILRSRLAEPEHQPKS
jgi:hypothetical protein